MSKSSSLYRAPAQPRALPMTQNSAGEWACADHPDFTPNVSPEMMFRAGIMGGSYFRNIAIRGVEYKDAWREFEPWWKGLDVSAVIANPVYECRRNRFRVKCGQSLDIWVEKGWIETDFDSHGWIHWYCRFWSGRRCRDDRRQIGRWVACAGPKGRWKRNLLAKCVKAGSSFDDESISPVVRQTLLHWAYQPTEEHYQRYKVLLLGGARTSFIPQHQMEHIVVKADTSEVARCSHDSGSEDEQHTPDVQSCKTTASRTERARKRARRS